MTARVLVVEDDPDSLSAITKLLQVNGYYVRGADGYQSAIEAVEQEPFDLLIGDIGLWDGDGCDLLQDLKRKHNIKGIALTGHGMPEEVERCLDAGFKSHMLKPVAISELLCSIEAMFGKRPLNASPSDGQP